MRRSRLLLGLVPTLPIAIAIGACANAPVQIGLVMRTPLGLLDQAKTVTLTVFDASKGKCSPTGHVDNVPAEGVQTFELKKGGCAGGAAWCTDIELDRDNSEKIFAVVAKGSSGILAEGCSVAKIDQDPLEVDIKVQRYNPPACCNDGALQVGEQCDMGSAGNCLNGTGGKCGGIIADEVCRCDCTAEEILLSVDNTVPPALTNGDVGTKRELAMAFSPGLDATKNALRTAYTNTDELGGGDIQMRFLQGDLYKIQEPFLLSQQLKLPALCANMNGMSPALSQHAPSVASVGLDRFLIAYASNQNGANANDVYLNIQNEWGCADGAPIKVTAQVGDTELRPDIAAGPADAALIVWHRGTATFGRIWRKGTGLDADELSIATSAKNPRVAGNKEGWIVVFEGTGAGDGDGVFMATVSPTGSVGASTLVNDDTMGVQDQPDVAMLDDGRSLIVWHSANGDDIHFQHFDAARMRVAGTDEQGAVNTLTEGVQQHPVVAGGLGFFAVAWEDAAGKISARFLGGTSGYGYNSVTGQNDAFVASTPDAMGTTGMRLGPAVAIGGAGFVAFGWEDQNENHHGVFVRRFPLPAGL